MKIDTLTKVFEEIWSMKGIKEGDEVINIKEEDFEAYVDPSHVFMIIPKTLTTKKIIEQFDTTKRDEKGKKLLKIFTYRMANIDETKEEICSKYTMDYLKIILELCKGYQSIKLKMRTDYPLWIETDDFICVLAPRVESDE